MAASSDRTETESQWMQPDEMEELANTLIAHAKRVISPVCAHHLTAAANSLQWQARHLWPEQSAPDN